MSETADSPQGNIQQQSNCFTSRSTVYESSTTISGRTAQDYLQESRSEDQDSEADPSEPWLLDANHPPAHYLQQLEDFNEQEYAQEDYSSSSTALLDRMEYQWTQCWTYLDNPSLRAYVNISVRALYTFFDWLLNQRRGKDGRRCRGTKFASSLGTYWKVFRLVYERATGAKIDGQMNRSMHKVLRRLAKKHDLKKIGRDKACMYVEDLTLVLQTNITTTEKKYPHGRYRIQAQLYLQLGGFTANRPAALLNLCYRHIRVTLLRDPEGGPHRLLLEFTFEFTKQYLGIKDLNTFPLPEIIFDETLICSPHVFLLGLLFNDRAFAADSLTSPERLSRLKIPSGSNELKLHLKHELNDVPIFRKAVKTLNGWAVSPDEPLPYSTLLPWIRTLGEITGFEQVTRPYSLRYAGGKAFNENGNVSEAMQNLMMGHASIKTFLRHYLSRRVTVDTQAVVRGIKPQDTLMRAACTMSRTIDQRRPRRLTTEQSLSVNHHPTVAALLKERERLGKKLKNVPDDPTYRLVSRRIIQERQRQRQILLQSIKEQWEYEQPLRDVESQLANGRATVKPHRAEAVALSVMSPAQANLAKSILAPPGNTVEEERERRDKAIRAVMVYCSVEEGGMHPTRIRGSTTAVSNAVKTLPECEQGALEAAKVAVYKDARPKICFLCLGNKMLPTEVRTYTFYTPGDLSKHFRRRHLQTVADTECVGCELCQVLLGSKMHLQRHALDVHGTVS